MVLRDDRGEFIRGKNLRYAGTVNVMEAEAIGLQEALAWLEDMGVQNAVIERDSQLVCSRTKNINLRLVMSLNSVVPREKQALIIK
ncbi:hypothetical protein DCAR_0728694 [Daucus carota subsp. sativus]|uniref:RNase H type-1 domain-containing protein n=1 Tax=Daucus carota subsp. sativus TaxID=79200 RepID=A0A161ZL28_DAUCS|nr:hypothetical protein DCAR_0728694 [Daucus carota subsp. sativus]